MKAPQHLNSDGRRLFESLTQEYSISDSGGVALVTVAAECLDRMRQAQAAIAEHGPVVKTGTDSVKSNPATKLEVDSRNGFLAALRQLNLDLEPLRDNPGRPTR